MPHRETIQPADGAAEASFSFGPFRLESGRQLLLEGDRPIPLGGRAFDILTALVSRPGELVGKEELVALVWPGISVDESNLRAQVSALRRALGERGGSRYVATVPGRGYRFVAPVTRSDAPPVPAPTRERALPLRLTQPVGRGEIVTAIGERLKRRRFVTLVGTGGIGKTTTALSVAEALAPSFDDGVCFIDLAPLADARHVPIALAAALGLSIVSDDPTPGAIAYLRERNTLVVLDGCEHYVEAAALLAEAALRGARGVHVLATSREPLRADGESVHRLPPLEVPPASPPPSAAEASTYSAVQLFVERAAACVDGFELSDTDAPLVAEICRRLDGLPLAIELVAGRIDAFGVRGVAEHLDDRFRLLARGRSTAPPRQQTLRATLDWSWELLREPARMVLRRLSAFSGSFTLASASAIAGDAAFDPAEVADRIADLVAKSLVSADVKGPGGAYRLLDTTRAYAREKLRESGELDAVSRRHAEHYRAFFASGGAGFETRSVAELAALHLQWIDELRSALDWAFSDSGDPELGVALTVATLPIGLKLSMMHECRARVERALATLAARGRDGENTRRGMQLHAALGADLMHTRGSPAEIRSHWAQAFALAEELGDVDHQLRALWGQWAAEFANAELPATLVTARRFRRVAERSPERADVAVGARMVGGSLFALGELDDARRLTEEMLAAYRGVPRHSDIMRFVFDQRVAAQGTLAAILWVQGFPEQARARAGDALAEAIATSHGLSVCSALSDTACPIALLTGDLDGAERLLVQLQEYAASHSLDVWSTWGQCFQAALRGERSDAGAPVDEQVAALEGIASGPFHPRYATSLTSLAASLGRAGQGSRALAVLDRTLERPEVRVQGWCLAELLRVKGDLLRARVDRRSPKLAEECLQQALDDAHRRGALSWELRSAMSLARLCRDAGRVEEARERLSSVYKRFREGFDTADLIAAARLLEELS